VQILQSVTLQIGPLQCTLNSATREQNRRQMILAVVFSVVATGRERHAVDVRDSHWWEGQAAHDDLH